MVAEKYWAWAAAKGYTTLDDPGECRLSAERVGDEQRLVRYSCAIGALFKRYSSAIVDLQHSLFWQTVRSGWTRPLIKSKQRRRISKYSIFLFKKLNNRLAESIFLYSRAKWCGKPVSNGLRATRTSRISMNFSWTGILLKKIFIRLKAGSLSKRWLINPNAPPDLIKPLCLDIV